MKMLLIVTVVAFTAASANAQDQTAERMRTIWTAIRARVEQQNDIWFKDGDFPRCIQALRFVNFAIPEDYELATSLGWLLESTELDDEALATYVRFKKQNPGDPDGPLPEANFYFMKKSYAKVPGLLEGSIKMEKPPHPNAFRVLAHSYERLGLLSDSKRVWTALTKLTPNDEAAKNNLRRVENKIKSGIGSRPAASDGRPASG